MDCMMLKSIPAHEHSPHCRPSYMLGILASIIIYSTNCLSCITTSTAVPVRVLLLTVSAAGVASMRAFATKQYVSTTFFTPAAAMPGCNLWGVTVSVRVASTGSGH